MSLSPLRLFVYGREPWLRAVQVKGDGRGARGSTNTAHTSVWFCDEALV